MAQYRLNMPVVLSPFDIAGANRQKKCRQCLLCRILFSVIRTLCFRLKAGHIEKSRNGISKVMICSALLR